MAADMTGNIYVADRGNHTIRKISTTGEVTTIAGKAGMEGFANGIGTAARFSNPRGITIVSGQPPHLEMLDQNRDTRRI